MNNELPLSLEVLDKNIAECRLYVERGEEKEETLEYFLKLRNDLAKANPSDWQSYNELTKHLPDEGADPVLIILKGQLLIETLIRNFIASRLPNPKVFESHNFSSAQCNAIAESLCLPNEEPRWLWEQIKELNSIRNKLSHTLNNDSLGKRINNFVSSVSNAQKLESKSLVIVIARLFGMMKGLCDISESKEFQIQTQQK